METIKTTVIIWAKKYPNEVTYLPSCADMSDYGYVRAGTKEVEVEVSEPDFEGIQALEEEKAELMARHEDEVKEINRRMSEVGQ